jgi:hypothetical protein
MSLIAVLACYVVIFVGDGSVKIQNEGRSSGFLFRQLDITLQPRTVLNLCLFDTPTIMEDMD